MPDKIGITYTCSDGTKFSDESAAKQHQDMVERIDAFLAGENRGPTQIAGLRRLVLKWEHENGFSPGSAAAVTTLKDSH